MDQKTKNEINGFYKDVKISEENLEHGRNVFAELLKNGLGDEMIEFLTKPNPVIVKKESVWSKLKKLF